MITRRHVMAPLAATLASTAMPADARTTQRPAEPPGHYDEPLGIGLEGWPYPAAVRFQPFTIDRHVDVRMAYMDIAPTAKASNRTVVLLHGKNFDSSYWAGPIKDLTASGYRVIVPDQIGFNKSAKPDLDYSFELLARLTINLLGALQIGQASFIGHSTGGMLAVRLAATYPEHVDRLILEDPIGLVDYRRYVPPQLTETLVANERGMTTSAYRAFVRRFFPVLPAQQIEPFVEWRIRVALSGEYERFCQAAAQTYQMIYREPVRDQYADIAADTLMIVGEKDVSAPLKQYASREMAARMPSIPEAAPGAVKDLRRGRLVVVPGVGHVPHLEAPDTFRQAVLAFLSG